MPKENIRKVAFALAAEQDRMVSQKEASAITGRSLASMWRDGKAGRFPTKFRTGQRSVGFRYSDLMAWMDSREVATEETEKPVAVPGPGKRRGRPGKPIPDTESFVPTAEQTQVGERFKTWISRIGLTPPSKIIPDGAPHCFEQEGPTTPPSIGWYIVDSKFPSVGLVSCKAKNISLKWNGQKSDALNYQDMAAYDAKLETLRNRLKFAKSKRTGEKEVKTTP